MAKAERDTSPIESITPQATPWQKAFTQRLLKLKHAGRLPHALLINPSTQQDSSAFGWYLVMALMCRQEQAGAPCGECSNCTLMMANTHPDLTYATLVENERNHKMYRDIRIEQIRNLIHLMSLTPSDSAGRFALLYPAERMNPNSANSLLKTLEEPSRDAKLILLSHNPGRLPVTVRSRCQQWSVTRPTASEASAWLESKGIDSENMDEYLKLAGGDPQWALQLHTQQALDHLKNFQQGLKTYLKTGSGLLSVVDQVKGLPENLLRLILRRTLLSFIYQQLERAPDSSGRQRLGALLDLIREADFNLQGQETNLIVNLQLEDVLISLKQILTGENRHASTRQPGHIVT